MQQRVEKKKIKTDQNVVRSMNVNSSVETSVNTTSPNKRLVHVAIAMKVDSVATKSKSLTRVS